MVSSAGPGEGKSTAVANLAASFARAGDSVLVLDFDLHRPEVHRYLGVPDSPRLWQTTGLPVGVSALDALATPSRIAGVRMVRGWLTADDGTDVVDHGHSLVAAARQLADVVIIDTPPTVATNEASVLLPVVDAVLVVCRVGRTTTEAALRMSELMARLGAAVLGIVLVGVPQPVGSWRYYSDRRYASAVPVGESSPLADRAAASVEPAASASSASPATDGPYTKAPPALASELSPPQESWPRRGLP